MPHVIEDVACTVCGCVCDDLSIAVQRDRIVRADRACRLAEPWFLGQGARQPPAALIDAAPVDLDQALARAAEVLKSAKSPLVYGMAGSSTPGIRAAVALADRLGATIDTLASPCHAASVMAVQQVGASTCTLGEVRNRADLIIYWGSNPVETHPRHLERYSLEPSGQYVPGGRADRTLVVVDNQPTATGKLADLFVPVEPGRHAEALWSLRALVRGMELPADRHPGLPREQLTEMARRMKACRAGIVFYGPGLTHNGLGHRCVEALLRLVRELNDHTRFYARAMPVPGEASGADNVLAWQTGYPMAVSLSRRYPRYGPGEYASDVMLRRGEVDACLLVGSDALTPLCAESIEHLRRIPLILIDGPHAQPAVQPHVHFTTSVYGVHLPGTAYRMDDVPIPLKRLFGSRYPSDADVLAGIRRRVSTRSGNAAAPAGAS